jgi:putative PIN family toxin of toxin-antitoxin system
VIDTNVIVSGLMRTSGPPAEALNAAKARVFSWLISPHLINEAAGVLSRPHIRRHITLNDEAMAEFFAEVSGVAILVEPTDRLDVSRDADDNRVLEAAVAGNADYIVTGDRDLLALGSHQGIQIVTPADFVRLLPR